MLSARVQLWFEQVVGIIGEEGAAVILSVLIGVTAYWVLLLFKDVVLPRVIARVERDADNDFVKGGRAFDAFTKRAWQIGFTCAVVVYAVIWVGKHFPSLWLVWFAMLAAAILSLSMVGYSRSGEKMTLSRFTKFYGPTVTVVTLQLPDVLKEFVKIAVANL